MKFHDELNPRLWTKDNELKQEVTEKLEEITQAFIEYLDIPLDAIEDVIITGSSANYNYTPQSDLDLHLRVDYDKVHEDCPIVEGYLWSMKAAFNKDHDISIYGVPVEVYAENVDIPAVSNGVYSLADDKWVKFPEKIPPTDNDLAVQAKFNELKEASERIEDSEVAEELLDKIYEMRKAGLADVGEFSTENMAFKMLRNEGVLERLKKVKKEKIDKQLSLESYKEEFFIGSDKYIIVPVSYAYNDIRILDKKTGEFLKNENGDILKFATEEECGNYIKSLDESIKESEETKFKKDDIVKDKQLNELIVKDVIKGDPENKYLVEYIYTIGNQSYLNKYRTESELEFIKGKRLIELEKILKINSFKDNKNESIKERFNKYYKEHITNNQLSSESFIKVSKKLKEVMEERPPMTFDQLINKFKDNIEEYKIQGKDVYDNLNDIIKETLPIYVEDMINIYKTSEDYFDPHLDDTLEDVLLEAISQALNTYFIRNMNDLI